MAAFLLVLAAALLVVFVFGAAIIAFQRDVQQLDDET